MFDQYFEYFEFHKKQVTILDTRSYCQYTNGLYIQHKHVSPPKYTRYVTCKLDELKVIKKNCVNQSSGKREAANRTFKHLSYIPTFGIFNSILVAVDNTNIKWNK